MRRPAVTCCAVAVAVTVGTASGCSLRTIGAPRGGTTLSATFDDVQSLVVGHSVQVSDVRVGTVTAIGLSGYRARVTMSLRDGRRIPVGTTATIAKSSLLGENYVRLDLPPGRDLRTGPFLPGGAAIVQTSVQPDLEQVSEKVGPLIAALGGQDLATIAGESATALDGRGRKLNTLIKRAADVTDGYAAASADLGHALDSLAKLGDSLEKGKGGIGRLPGDIALATQRLQDERHRIKTSIRRLEQLARSVNAKVQQRHAKRLGVLLGRADQLLAAALRGRDDLKALAANVLTFLRGPSVSYSGQALLFLWIKGFLPQQGKAPADARPQSRSLTGLLGPRP
ncbi:MlaD family protein [Actinomadura opuntiae]|uniref:MlaD family protein n=1 Tax=Actinomadura sp. OS1-43 TaxID=604315 RepID=UPI00255ABF20|nr:MCE family protein [Actinomadura sp. OS1-43]MDL4814299.1 MCE family protein [Actinomadura sp. OS1-43]